MPFQYLMAIELTITLDIKSEKSGTHDPSATRNLPVHIGGEMRKIFGFGAAIAGVALSLATATPARANLTTVATISGVTIAASLTPLH